MAETTENEPPVTVEFPAYQQGMQALADHLPELAVTRFSEAFKIPNLTDAQNREILYRLTEAQVRANQTTEALKTLRGKFLQDHPERHFWLAQALAAAGRYREACTHFAEVPAKSKNYTAALLSLANLQLALNQNEAAADTLKLALASSQTHNKANAAAQLASLYLELGNFNDAEKLTNSIPTNDPKGAVLRDFLLAKFALNKKEYSDATTRFKALTENQDSPNQRIFLLSFIGLIDTLNASGHTDDALSEIEQFINTHPESDILTPLLERYIQWQPKTFTSDSSFYKKLETWSGKATPPSLLPLSITDSDRALNPLAFTLTRSTDSAKLTPTARFFYAQTVAKLDSPDALERALFEHAAFRMDFPQHPLVSLSIFSTAEILLKLKRTSAARSCLADLRYLNLAGEINLDANHATLADFIYGQLSVDADDYSEALDAFNKAAESPIPEIASSATINAGLAALRSSDLSAFDAKQNKITDQQLSTDLILERSLWLAQNNQPEAKDALSSFLNKSPDHPRATEARIALASICATQPPLDSVMCRALLDTIDPETLSDIDYLSFMRTTYQLAELNQDWSTAISSATALLSKEDNAQLQQEFTMRLGLAYYRNGEHNKARQILSKLADEKGSPDLAAFALYYAGMAARLEGTPQSLKESVDLFEKVVTSKTSLVNDARIQQARILIDLDQTEQAITSLTTIFDSTSNSTQKLEIGLLLASAYHIQGNQEPASYKKAIAIYDDLLGNEELALWTNQIHYRKGFTQESMGKNDQALETYYQVINRENIVKGQQPEWHWFYQSCSKAISILVKQQNIRAAIAVAKKVASYGGPESDIYLKRSRDLEMEHMIWED